MNGKEDLKKLTNEELDKIAGGSAILKPDMNQDAKGCPQGTVWVNRLSRCVPITEIKGGTDATGSVGGIIGVVQTDAPAVPGLETDPGNGLNALRLK